MTTPPAPNSWLEGIADTQGVRRFSDSIANVGAGEVISARGAIGSSTALVTAALQRRLNRTFLLVVAHLDEADEALDELEGIGVLAARFPALELSPGRANVSLDLLSDRLLLVQDLIEGRCPHVVIAPVQALMQTVPRADRLGQMLRVIRPKDRVDTIELSAWLVDAGYTRVETIDAAGEFAIRGGIIDIFPPSGVPTRLDLFGDEVDAIHEVDLGSMGSEPQA